ncbi:MAG: methylcrotonoyl-CoA carboxylase [Ignavibacteriae bacterium HGW-Ignavibacteriae-2]|nr:MAG: methylcrotonoyl-CoA carboxylase [Ignavibacteriae bacterium HGW-Ignavibacteriae-2]
MKVLGSHKEKNGKFFLNEDYQKNLVRKITAIKRQVELGGGEKYIAHQHAKGKLTARERIARLIDKNSQFIELNSFAAYGMYEEYGGAPSAGTVFGIGRLNGRDHLIVANDATVKAGAWFPLTAKKNLRAQEIAMENRLPIIYLVDSAGVFLPLQEEIFPDKEHFGRIFRNNARLSAMGVPQLSAIMGPCVAGGAYLPIMSDEALIVEGEGSVFLAGPHLVKAAIGEEIDNESLGGAVVQSNVSGVTDYVMKNDDECLEQIRRLTDKTGPSLKANFNRIKSEEPLFPTENIYGILPKETTEGYDTYELLAHLVDKSEIDEYKAGYGKTLITAYARIDGWAVGIVANQRKIVKTELKEMQIGGVIYSDSSDKAARFIMNCNQKKIPLIFLQDVTGFMVGSNAEHGGIIKDGAKMVNAVANSVVPKITIIVGNSFGAGNYAMCGKAYDPRFIFAYPNAKIAVMGGTQASSVLLDIKIKQLKKQGKIISESEENEILNEVKKSYDSTSDPLYAAARLWVDEIIDPARTRDYISRSLDVCNNNPDIEKFSTGVIQT